MEVLTPLTPVMRSVQVNQQPTQLLAVAALVHALPVVAERAQGVGKHWATT